MFTRLVEPKIKTGFVLPSPIIDAYEQVAERLGGKEKWIVIAAGIVALSRLTEDEQNRLFASIKAADSPGGSIASLLGNRPNLKIAAKHRGPEPDKKKGVP